MIRIEDLTFTYPGAEKETLKNISLHVEKGDFLAVIGNNGCGKSTLCKALNGLIPHFIAGDMTGRVWIDGQDTAERDVAGWRKRWDMYIRILKIRSSAPQCWTTPPFPA